MDNPFIDSLLDFHESLVTLPRNPCGRCQTWTMEELARAVLQANCPADIKVHESAIPLLVRAITIEAWNTCEGHS